MDLVYLCREGANEELRYSLRSVAAHLEHDNIWVFGGMPEWVTGVTLVPTDQGHTRFRNTTGAMMAACRHEGVSDPFILMNDDFFIMRPVDTIPVLNRGLVRSVIAEYQGKGLGGSAYCSGMRDTMELLKGMGIEDPLSYELHVPMVVHKDVMLRAIFEGSGIEVLHKRTVYGNLLGITGETVQDVKVIHAGQDVPQGPWASSHDPLFHLVAPVVRYLFPNPCEYEDEMKEVNNMTERTPTMPTEGVPVYSPNRSYTGETAGVQFVNGNGMIPADHPRRDHMVDWFRGHGYSIGNPVVAEEVTEPVEGGQDQEAVLHDQAGAVVTGAQEVPGLAPAGTFDPTEARVSEVMAYLKGVDPDEKARVVALERAGKNRSTIVNA